MRFDGRFVQEILKLNVHPAFYHMSLIEELERNKENSGINDQKKTTQSSALSKKYFKTIVTDNNSSIGPIFEVAESAAQHKVYDGKYTVSNFGSQYGIPKSAKTGSPVGKNKKETGKITSITPQPNEMTPGFSGGLNSMLKKQCSKQRIIQKGSTVNLMERDSEVAEYIASAKKESKH